MLAEHIKKNIKSLYDVAKHKLGSNFSERKEKFISILKIYYPWEKKSVLQTYYATIRNEELEYIKIEGIKSIRDKYHNDIKSLFGLVDENNDECINLEEFKNVMTNVLADTEEIFKAADVDKNGTLDYDEFYKLVYNNRIIYNNINFIVEDMLFKKEELRKWDMLAIFKTYAKDRRPSLADLRPLHDTRKSKLYERMTL